MVDFSKITDKELVGLIRLNDLAAFKEIYNRYWKKLFSEAYKRLKDRELSEELVQDLFTKFWIKRNSLELRNELSSYFNAAITHSVIDQYRKDMVRERFRKDFIQKNTEWDNSTENEILAKDLNNVIALKVTQLPDKCRYVYELSRVEHKSNQEIAQFLGISEKTVENHLTKALKTLRVELLQVLLLFLFLK